MNSSQFGVLCINRPRLVQSGFQPNWCLNALVTTKCKSFVYVSIISGVLAFTCQYFLALWQAPLIPMSPSAASWNDLSTVHKRKINPLIYIFKLPLKGAYNFFPIILCVWVVCLHGCLCSMCVLAQGDQRTTSNPRELELHTDSYGCWEVTPSPLEEQPVLLTTEPSLQTWIFNRIFKIYVLTLFKLFWILWVKKILTLFGDCVYARAHQHVFKTKSFLKSLKVPFFKGCPLYFLGQSLTGWHSLIKL